MTTPTWPATLPQYVEQNGYAEAMPDLTIESSVDSGPPIVRRRFTKNFRQMQCTIRCEAAQKATFELFYLETLAAGTLPFYWVNPITQQTALFRFRRPPPRITPLDNGVDSSISFTLWQLAVFAEARFDVDTITFDSTTITFDAANSF